MARAGPLSHFPKLAKTRGGAFYLHGDDDFRKEEIVRALVDAHLDPATADFNLDPLRGTEVETEALASVLATPPMMAEWRVVVVREVEGLAGSSRAREVLLGAVSAPPPGLALILSCNEPAKQSKFYKDLAAKARSAEFRLPSAADVPGWLIARSRDHLGLELEVEAAQALGAAVGAHLGVLAQELEKLAAFVQGRDRINVEDVRAAGIRLPTQDRWQWVDLVGNCRFEEARATLTVLLGQGESGVSLTIALATHLLRLGVVAGGGTAALDAILPGNQKWLANKLPSQAKRWAPGEIDAALEGLLRVDRVLKSSSIGDEHVLEEWLLGLQAGRVA